MACATGRTGPAGAGAGQVWRMALVLRRPAGLRNAGLPDAEGRMFALGLRATGTVRGQPKFLADRPWAGPGVVIERARHRIRAGMRRALDGHRYAPVLIALAIGDQAGVAREDWRLFNRSGITHLVSISGMHVTSIAGVAGMLAAFLWRRARWRGIGLPSARRRASWAAWRPPGSRCCIACSRAGACRPGAPSSCWRRCWRRPCRACP